MNKFSSLLADIFTAKNRSQLEYAKDVAETFLQSHLDAADITAVDYHAKQAQINDAYHKQLLEFGNLNPMQIFNGVLHSKIAGDNHE